MTAVITPGNLNPAHFDIGAAVANRVSLRPGAVVSSSAGVPAAPPAADGPVFRINTATTPHSLYHWDGSAWNPVGDGVGAGGGGEANTASSVGTGVPVVDSKVGVDLRFKSLVAGAGVTITDNGDDITITSTVVGGGADGVVTNVQLVGSNLNFTGTGGGFNGSVDLSALGGGADGVVTAASLSGANILTLTRSIGAPVTVDLSALAGGGGGVSGVTGSAPITVGGTAANPVIGFDPAALTPAQAASLAAVLCASDAFRECVRDLALGLIRDDGDGTFTVAHDTDGAGNFVYTDCP